MGYSSTSMSVEAAQGRGGPGLEHEPEGRMRIPQEALVKPEMEYRIVGGLVEILFWIILACCYFDSNSYRSELSSAVS